LLTDTARAFEAINRISRVIERIDELQRSMSAAVDAQINARDYEGAPAALKQAQPVMDSMVNKGIFPKNKVARLKSRMSGKIKALKA